MILLDPDLILSSLTTGTIAYMQNLDGVGTFSNLYVIASDVTAPELAMPWDIDCTYA